MKPLLGLSLMHEDEFLQAALPLFVDGKVDLVEWSFDTIRSEKAKPEWLHQILTEYSQQNRLIGHGVRYSLFTAKWTNNQTRWLKNLQKELHKYNYNHITEHFGFMSSSDFHKGAPLPVTLSKTTLQIGHDRIKRLQDIAGNLPIGIENLAFAFSKEDVKKHGEFLNELIRPVNGFLILDLHNIYCQSQNFKFDFLELIKSYPLDKVREIHISGGSWQNSVYTKSIKKVRRDTHDNKVPKEIFDILPEVLSICPNLQYIIFERMGSSLTSEKDQIHFRKDHMKLRSIIDDLKVSSPHLKKVIKKKIKISDEPLNKLDLYREQLFLSKVLTNGLTPSIAFEKLNKKQLKFWNVDEWNISMLETAINITKKWA